MEGQPREVHQGVALVSDFDKEEFLLKLGEAVAQWTNPTAAPQVSFSTTLVGDQILYAAIVIGRGDPDANVKFIMAGEDEDEDE